MPASDSLERIWAGTRPEAEDDDLGPCCSRPAAAALTGFHVRRATQISKTEPTRKTTRSFDYSHLGYREIDEGNEWFVVEVNEPEKWRLRVEGRALWRVYAGLHRHRLEWIEPVTGHADMAIPNGVPVVLRITVERIEDASRDARRPGSAAGPSGPGG